MRRSLFCLLVSALAACGGTDGGTATPEPSADPGAGASASADARPCSGYVERGLRCEEEAAAASGWSFDAEERERVRRELRDECRVWFEDGVTRAEMDEALQACDTVSCAEDAGFWRGCVTEDFPVGPAGSSWAPNPPTEWTRIPPRPIPADVEPCRVFTEWLIDCATKGLPPETVESLVTAMRDGFEQACVGFRSAGMEGYIGEALVACADVACGPGGSDISVCITNVLAEAAMRDAGAAP